MQGRGWKNYDSNTSPKWEKGMNEDDWKDLWWMVKIILFVVGVVFIITQCGGPA